MAFSSPLTSRFDAAMRELSSSFEPEPTKKPWDHQRRWRSAFLPQVERWSSPSNMQFAWNAIGAPGTEFVEGAEAIRCFDEIEATSVFVCNEPGVGLGKKNEIPVEATWSDNHTLTLSFPPKARFFGFESDVLGARIERK